LFCKIPVWLDLGPVTHLRITTVVLQRRPARLANVWRVQVVPDMTQCPPDLHALGNVEVHMPVQAGAEPVSKINGADLQGRLIHLGCTGAVILRAFCNDPEEEAQHRIEHYLKAGDPRATLGVKLKFLLLN
jgi:hypothetical protein